MRVLILGATGFLGSNVFKLAKSLGYTVLGTSRYNQGKSNIIQLDVTNKDAVEDTIKTFQPDIIVWSLLSRDKEDLLIKYGLKNVLSAINENVRFIFISTDAVFSEGKGGYLEPDETTSLNDVASLATYVNSKILAEKMVRDELENYIIIRTGPLYGKDVNQKNEVRTEKIITEVEENGFAVAAQNVYRTFVHIEDLSKSIIELMTREYVGILHMGPQEKESYFAFYQRRLKDLGYDPDGIKPTTINLDKNPYVSLDTSLNTQKVARLLDTKFRNLK